MEGPPGCGLLFELRGRRDSAARNRQIRALRNPSETVIRTWKRRGPEYREEMEEFCRIFLEPPGDLLFPCGAGREGCLDAYGSYRRSFPGPSLAYDLKRGSLKTALTEFFPGLREMRAKNPDYLGAAPGVP